VGVLRGRDRQSVSAMRLRRVGLRGCRFRSDFELRKRIVSCHRMRACRFLLHELFAF
jgi:hypothetical protein